MPDAFLNIVSVFSWVGYEITILFNSVNEWKIEFCNSKIIENLYTVEPLLTKLIRSGSRFVSRKFRK